jgi:hypothetical protein
LYLEWEKSIQLNITATRSWQISLTGTVVSKFAFSRNLEAKRLRNTDLDILLSSYSLKNIQNVKVLIFNHTPYLFDIHLYLTPLGQARQFIETCGT